MFLGKQLNISGTHNFKVISMFFLENIISIFKNIVTVKNILTERVSN